MCVLYMHIYVNNWLDIDDIDIDNSGDLIYNMVIWITCLIRGWECRPVVKHVLLLKANVLQNQIVNPKPHLLTGTAKGSGAE